MKKPSIRQMKYARGLMNENKSKQQIALEAGFSYSTSRVPKLIENKKGFKLAMAQLAGDMENLMLKLMFELETRDLSKLSNNELNSSLLSISKIHERFASQLH